MRKTRLLPLLALTGFGLGGCALLAPKPGSQINMEPNDRVFLKVAAFDSTVQAELKRVGLDPARIQEGLVSELHYQLFLKNQEEAPDSAGATLRITVSLTHVQPGTGNSGDFMLGTVTAQGKTTQTADLELRNPSKANIPAEFLSLHLPRSLAKEILAVLKKKTKSPNSELGYPPPLILLN